jgi:Zn-dependent protease
VRIDRAGWLSVGGGLLAALVALQLPLMQAALSGLSVLVHEMGHAIVLQNRHRHGAVISLTAQVGTKHPLMEMDDKMMALCGPALQSAYGVAVLCFGSLSNSLFFMVVAYYILADMLFNMLPFKGHDGYIVFRRAQPQSCH